MHKLSDTWKHGMQLIQKSELPPKRFIAIIWEKHALEDEKWGEWDNIFCKYIFWSAREVGFLAKLKPLRPTYWQHQPKNLSP